VARLIPALGSGGVDHERRQSVYAAWRRSFVEATWATVGDRCSCLSGSNWRWPAAGDREVCAPRRHAFEAGWSPINWALGTDALMGMTLPLLTSLLRNGRARSCGASAGLYFVNTLGAACGALWAPTSWCRDRLDGCSLLRPESSSCWCPGCHWPHRDVVLREDGLRAEPVDSDRVAERRATPAGWPCARLRPGLRHRFVAIVRNRLVSSHRCAGQRLAYAFPRCWPSTLPPGDRRTPIERYCPGALARRDETLPAPASVISAAVFLTVAASTYSHRTRA